jgi:DNA gyrase subunit A
MGRQAAGVNAMRLDEGDYITSMDIVDAACDLLVVTQKAFGKRTSLDEYTARSRATGGIATIAQRSLDTTGLIVAARVVHEDDELTVISTFGQALRLKVKAIRHAGRATMGNRLINLREGDTIASVARLAAKDIAMKAAEADGADGTGQAAVPAPAVAAEPSGNGSGPE